MRDVSVEMIYLLGGKLWSWLVISDNFCLWCNGGQQHRLCRLLYPSANCGPLQILSLSINERVRQAQGNSAQQQQHFAEFLLALGEERFGPVVQLHHSMFIPLSFGIRELARRVLEAS